MTNILIGILLIQAIFLLTWLICWLIDDRAPDKPVDGENERKVWKDNSK